MSITAKQIQEIPAIKDLRHLLSLVLDKDAQKDAKAFLGKYQALHDGINENLVTHGYGEANAKLVTLAVDDRRLAAEELVGAQREAAELLAEANTEVENAHALVDEAVTTQLRKESAFEQESGRVREEQAALATSLESREAAVEAQKLENTTAKERLAVAQTEHEAKAKRLQEALS